MRVFAFALCGALLSASLAVAAPADRAALLERLRVALPRITDFMPVEEMITGDLRESMIAQNPGKEAAVGPIVDEFGACVVRMVDKLDYAGAAVAGADKAGMTEAELLKVIAFYEDPDMKVLFGKFREALASGEEPDIDPAAFARLEKLGEDPAVERFGEIMQQSAGEMFDEDALTDDVVVCTSTMDAAIDDAGLTYDPDLIEVITEEEADALEKDGK